MVGVVAISSLVALVGLKIPIASVTLAFSKRLAFDVRETEFSLRRYRSALSDHPKERERTVRDLRASLKEATDRLSTYDGLPESQKIRQRMLDLEVSEPKMRNGGGGGA